MTLCVRDLILLQMELMRLRSFSHSACVCWWSTSNGEMKKTDGMDHLCNIILESEHHWLALQFSGTKCKEARTHARTTWLEIRHRVAHRAKDEEKMTLAIIYISADFVKSLLAFCHLQWSFFPRCFVYCTTRCCSVSANIFVPSEWKLLTFFICSRLKSNFSFNDNLFLFFLVLFFFLQCFY